MIEHEQISAMILVGGKSRRMKYQDKMNLILGERTFLERIQNCVTDFKQVYISISQQQESSIEFNVDSSQVVVDLFDSIGPMGGIYSVMKTMRQPTYLLVLSCDIPFITAQEISLFTNQCQKGYDAYIAVINEKIQPLFAIYHSGIQNRMYQQIMEGDFRIIDLYDEMKVQYINLGEQPCFYNINTLEELEKAKHYIENNTEKTGI